MALPRADAFDPALGQRVLSSVVLATAYPRGRWLFIGLAAGCGLARVLTLDHYLSDVFAGLVLGSAAGLWAAHSRALGRLIERIEARRRRRSA